MLKMKKFQDNFKNIIRNLIFQPDARVSFVGMYLDVKKRPKQKR